MSVVDTYFDAATRGDKVAVAAAKSEAALLRRDKGSSSIYGRLQGFFVGNNNANDGGDLTDSGASWSWQVQFGGLETGTIGSQDPPSGQKPKYNNVPFAEQYKARVGFASVIKAAAYYKAVAGTPGGSVLTAAAWRDVRVVALTENTVAHKATSRDAAAPIYTNHYFTIWLHLDSTYRPLGYVVPESYGNNNGGANHQGDDLPVDFESFDTQQRCKFCLAGAMADIPLVCEQCPASKSSVQCAKAGCVAYTDMDDDLKYTETVIIAFKLLNKPESLGMYAYYLCGGKDPALIRQLQQRWGLDCSVRCKSLNPDVRVMDSQWRRIIKEDSNAKAYAAAEQQDAELAMLLLGKDTETVSLFTVFEQKGFLTTHDGGRGEWLGIFVDALKEGASIALWPDWQGTLARYRTWSAVQGVQCSAGQQLAIGGVITSKDDKLSCSGSWRYNLRDNYRFYPVRFPNRGTPNYINNHDAKMVWLTRIDYYYY
jgi:hypothetical protein